MNRPARHPTTLELQFPAVADQLADIRRALDAWLEQCAMDDTRASDVLLAVNEACTNAVEHGHRGDGRLISLTARVESDELHGDELHIVIADHGKWKPPRAEPDSTRGRGIAIIRALFPDTTMTTGDAGTVVTMRARITE